MNAHATNIRTHARTRPLRRLAALGTAGLLATGATLGLALGAAAPALAHDELTDYGLQVDNSTGKTTALTMSFSDKVLAVGTEIHVLDVDEKDHADGAPLVQDTTVHQPISDMTEGTYSIAWRVVSSDGHPIEGLLAFQIDAEGVANWIPAGDAAQTPGTSGDPQSVTSDNGEAAAADDQADHAEHADAQQASEPQAGTTIAIAAVAVLVVAGAVTVSVVGSRRRKQAIDDAAAGNDADPSAQGVQDQVEHQGAER
ncbi:MAG: copper resistance protein CopC [Actinobacteria bacterium]|nr:copper resistance protein CopC [Actinomycetota bacterium]